MTDITETSRSFQDTGSDERTTGVAAGRRPRLGWILGLTSAAYFMVVLDSLVVITALPRMQRDLHVGLPTLQWTVNSYGIAFAAGIITAAALGDRLGRRRVFVAGLALFTLASAACALAPGASALIAARAAQALHGAAARSSASTAGSRVSPWRSARWSAAR
jgi:MFS family permease